jgi:TM2 domain-containing membrane protein YozV
LNPARLLVILLFLASFSVQAQSDFSGWKTSVFFEKVTEDQYKARSWWFKEGRENPRLVAIVLDITVGLFGAHRMYLGTDVKVPVFYTLTAGGGGILWLIDLGLLVASKDITPFLNNPHIFMWVSDEKTP